MYKFLTISRMPDYSIKGVICNYDLDNGNCVDSFITKLVNRYTYNEIVNFIIEGENVIVSRDGISYSEIIKNGKNPIIFESFDEISLDYLNRNRFALALIWNNKEWVCTWNESNINVPLLDNRWWRE